VGSIAHTSESNCENKSLLRKFAAHPAANTWRDTRNFFADCGFVLGTRMSHCGSELLDGLGNLWGEFEVAEPFGICDRAIAKKQTALGAKSAPIVSENGFTSSTQFLRDPHETGSRKFLSWRDSTRAQHDCKGVNARGTQLKELE